jgi:hypothetical protein
MDKGKDELADDETESREWLEVGGGEGHVGIYSASRWQLL